ncbi:hypothetical protein B566_EDAN008915 [Ephemera danica]|nr:hypothetical protein B566_EDAN008915 [Ephemera danica]
MSQVLTTVRRNLKQMGQAGKYEEMDGSVQPSSPAATALQSGSGPGDYNENLPPAQDIEMTSVSVIPDDTYTVTQAVNAFGFGKFQVKLSLFTGLCWMADSMEMTILSILSPALHCDWRISRYQQALTTTASGIFRNDDKFYILGEFERSALTLCGVLLFSYGFMSSFAPNYAWILFLRGLVGFAIGCVPQSVTLYAEFLPTKQRAKCVWLPESARYHVACGRPDRAEETLKCIAKDNGRPMAATAFCYYGTVLMTTELFEANESLCSKRDIPTAAETCAADCRPLTTADYMDLLWTTLAEFPGTLTLLTVRRIFATIFVIERFGRKKTMAVQFVIFAVCVSFLYICTSNRTFLTVMLFVARGIIAGIFQAAYVYTPEVYPTPLRAIGVGACSGMARFGAMVTPYVAQVLLKSSLPLAVTVYAVAALLAAAAAFMLPYETRGAEMKDTVASVSK